jgi:hypothetical protein
MMPTHPGARFCSATAVLVAALIAVAACGSDEETHVGSSSTTTTSSTSTSSGGAGGSAGATAGGGGFGGGAGGSGDGQIIVDPDNSAWLKYRGGGPFFLAAPGDPEGFLYRGTRNTDGTRDGDQLDIVAKLAPTGANGIYLMAVRSHGGDGGPTENPFEDSDPSGALDADILDQWEIWLSAMDAAGITIFFFFYDDSASLWATGDSLGTEEQTFVTALVDRFKHHRHLIWVIAEEYSESFSAPRISAIAAAIAAADDKDHVIAVHQLNSLSFDFPADPHIDQFAIQYNVTTAAALHTGMVQTFQSAAGAYNINMAEAAGWGTGDTARRKSWATAMGGAYVMVLGMNVATTAVGDLEALGRLRTFMEATTINRMAPHDELAHGATDYVLADPGHAYIAYAAALTGDMGLADMTAGDYLVRWLDAASGTTINETVTVTGGDQTFIKPGSIGDDVAVYVERQ